MRINGLYFPLWATLKRVLYQRCGCDRCAFATMYLEDRVSFCEMTAFAARAWWDRHVTSFPLCPNGIVRELTTFNILLSGDGRSIDNTRCHRCCGPDDRSRTLSVRVIEEVPGGYLELTLTCDRCGPGKPARINWRAMDELAELMGADVRSEVFVQVLKAAWPRKETAA